MNIASELIEFLSRHDASNKKYIVAVSGGSDSMALLFCCYQLKLNIVAAHCNFKLRAHESDLDEKLVADFCTEKNIPFEYSHFLTKKIANQQKLSIQETARNMRYNWFEELRIKHHADYILTAHHGNDLIETFIFNLCRGAGVNGLTSIPEKNGAILRPWLRVNKHHINQFVVQNQIPYRDDVSNFKDEYKRNYIRQQIVPLLSNINTAAEQHVIEAVFSLKENATINNEKIKELKQELTHVSNNQFTINLTACLKKTYAKQLLISWLMPYGFNKTTIDNLLTSKLKTGSKWLSLTHQITYSRGKVVVVENINTLSKQVLITAFKYTIIDWYNYNIAIDFTTQIPESFKADSLYLSVNQNDLPFTIRAWEHGDKFIPFGMQTFKKVSDFFIDNKIDLNAKNEAAVISSPTQIMAVLPYRTDNRTKVTPQSKTIMIISMKHP